MSFFESGAYAFIPAFERDPPRIVTNFAASSVAQPYEFPVLSQEKIESGRFEHLEPCPIFCAGGYGQRPRYGWSRSITANILRNPRIQARDGSASLRFAPQIVVNRWIPRGYAVSPPAFNRIIGRKGIADDKPWANSRGFSLLGAEQDAHTPIRHTLLRGLRASSSSAGNGCVVAEAVAKQNSGESSILFHHNDNYEEYYSLCHFR